MKIDGINNNVINFYKRNAVKTQANVSAIKRDTIELSTAGKSLSALSLDDKLINSKEKIQAIRNEIEQGTYNIDSSLTAKKIIDIMKGRDI